MARQSPKQQEQAALEALHTLVAPRKAFIDMAVTGPLAVARAIYQTLASLVGEVRLIVESRDAQVAEQQRKALAAKVSATKARLAKVRLAKARKPRATRKGKARRKGSKAAPVAVTPTTPADPQLAVEGTISPKRRPAKPAKA